MNRLSSPVLYKLGMVEHTCNPRTWQVEAGGWEVQEQPHLLSECGTTVGYTVSCLLTCSLRVRNSYTEEGKGANNCVYDMLGLGLGPWLTSSPLHTPLSCYPRYCFMKTALHCSGHKSLQSLTCVLLLVPGKLMDSGPNVVPQALDDAA